MLQTLFYIHDHLFGIPLFGVSGLIFFIWTVAALFILGRLTFRVFQLMKAERQRGRGAAKGTEREKLVEERKRAGIDLVSTMAVLALVGAAIALYVPSLMTKIPGSEELGLPIRGYGMMVLAGVVAGVWLAVRRAAQRGFEAELIFGLALWLFLGGIIGARLFYVAEYWGTQFRHVDAQGNFEFGASLRAVLNIAQGGLVIYGALIGGGVAGLLFWLRHRTLPMLKIADAIAPSMALGLALGRVGCFLNGCCFGGPSNLPWAIPFPEHSPPYLRQIENGQLPLHGMTLAWRPPDSSDSGSGSGVSAGVEITSIDPESKAAKAGLEKGDRIIEIEEQLTGDPKSAEKRYPKPREDASNAEPDATIDAARRALLGINTLGAKIRVFTAEQEKPFEWAVSEGDLPTRSLPTQPTQLYSAIDAALLCLLLLAFDPFRTRDGEVLALMLTLHPISRFLLESIRTDEPKIFPLLGYNVSISQLISVMIFVAAAGLWAYIILRKPRLDGSDLYYYDETAEDEATTEIPEQPTVVEEQRPA